VPSTSYKNEEDYLQLVQESLKNLQTSYLDMMLLHWPGVYGTSNRSKETIQYRHSAWKALSKFKEQGLIRSIGVSNFLIRHLEELKKECDVVPALNQVEYHPKCYDFELLQYCKDRGILMQAYSSLGTSGDLSLRNDATVKSISKNYSKSASQVLLRWALKRNVGIIPKASSRLHLEENMDMAFDISENDMQTLDSMRTDNNDERFDWDPNDVI
jgi:diketogulonate reductase-like aldo/keto reductase